MKKTTTMIELKTSSVELSQAHKIMRFTETILEDEFPLIRLAKTELGDTVIVLTVDNDDDTNAFRYLYILLSEQQEKEYRESKITLRDIILSSPWLPLIETNENDEPIKVYQLDKDSFPKEYLPLDGSYIPKSYLRNLKQISDESSTIKDKTFQLTFSILEAVLKVLKQKGIQNYDSYLAEKMTIPETNISRILSFDGNFTIQTLLKVLDAVDLEMEVRLYGRDTLKPFDHVAVAEVRMPETPLKDYIKHVIHQKNLFEFYQRILKYSEMKNNDFRIEIPKIFSIDMNNLSNESMTYEVQDIRSKS